MKGGIVVTLKTHYWFEHFLPRFIAKRIVRWIAGRATARAIRDYKNK